jgi:Holliday junction resolvasome RuvABC endonuclease subunit
LGLIETCYVGIDPSLTGTGLVILNKDGVITYQELISTKPSTEIEFRFEHIVNKLKLALSKEEDVHPKVCMEGLSYCSKGQSVLELSALHYMIRMMLRMFLKVPYEVIPPTVVKKFVSGSGAAKKELMLLNVYKKWGVSFEDNNLADAYSLARYCMENMK